MFVHVIIFLVDVVLHQFVVVHVLSLDSLSFDLPWNHHRCYFYWSWVISIQVIFYYTILELEYNVNAKWCQPRIYFRRWFDSETQLRINQLNFIQEPTIRTYPSVPHCALKSSRLEPLSFPALKSHYTTKFQPFIIELKLYTLNVNINIWFKDHSYYPVTKQIYILVKFT